MMTIIASIHPINAPTITKPDSMKGMTGRKTELVQRRYRMVYTTVASAGSQPLGALLKLAVDKKTGTTDQQHF